jgi:hypothetical protein
MVIERLSFPMDSDTGNQLLFEIDMKQIRIVKPYAVKIEQVSEDVVTAALKSFDLGSQVTKGVSAPASSALGMIA